MRSARPDRPGAGRAPATSPAPSVSPKSNGYLLRYSARSRGVEILENRQNT
jgi:hypothetical protein